MGSIKPYTANDGAYVKRALPLWYIRDAKALEYSVRPMSVLEAV